MINAGSNRLEMWDDGWTVSTRDLQRSAQFEHTVLVTEAGFELLTVPGQGEPADARFAGVRMGTDQPVAPAPLAD
jgi:methionyl aminopeptidase